MEILAAIVDCGVKKLLIGGASVGLRRGGSERNRAGYWRGEEGYARLGELLAEGEGQGIKDSRFVRGQDFVK